MYISKRRKQKIKNKKQKRADKKGKASGINSINYHDWFDVTLAFFYRCIFFFLNDNLQSKEEVMATKKAPNNTEK
mgnify:CR=1 FL=1